MKFSLYQEFYKFVHRKLTWIAPLILLLLMIITGYSIGYHQGKLLTMTCYNSPDWIVLILIIVGSTMFSMEFQNNAILTLIYKSKSKIQVYLAKYVIIFGYNLILHGLAILYTVVLRYATLNSRVSWSTIYRYQQPLWQNMLLTSLVDLLATTLIITLVFLLSCLIENNAVVTTLSFLIVFMGQAVSASLLNLGRFTAILKWNPLNMTNLTRQYYNYVTYFQTSHLLNSQLVVGALLYIVIFFILGYQIFRSKRF
ncbi:ABC transporter permease [Lapidilactobacillus wuchangensis]|uniref:ABC transporter permease n=1 Tax=Lapidilactobacillus wuchangensis TaxID=2486001 RepID=UPI000F796CF1|nr:ABC transporter permease [Lapidilactobacillus wuchangensis]